MRDVLHKTKIDGMKQIATGISFLHSQDIVHRDIKPGNILVASENPFRLLLADFDVCKCLDPEVETSLMTSNVGTLAFKAPEFFQRTSPGKIEYHRNVDIYAAGLTFLAILQAKKGQKMLIPQIETPMEDSELHVPSIGQLISERIKYKVGELNVATFDGPAKNVKGLISQMTCVHTQERLSARKFLDVLESLKTNQISKKKLIHRRRFWFSFTSSMDVTVEDILIVRVLEGRKYSIRRMHRQTGDVINEFPSKCSHFSAFVKTYPQNEDYLLESCPECEEIRAYNVNTSERFTVYNGPEAIIICNGPAGSLLVIGREDGLFMLNWHKDQLHEAEVVYAGKIPATKLDKRFIRFFYVESLDILINTGLRELTAVKLESGTLLWRLFGPVNGVLLKPGSITCDTEGNAYVSDLGTNRILQIDIFTGEVLSVLLMDGEEKENIISIRWSNTEPNLTVRTGKHISTYN